VQKSLGFAGSETVGTFHNATLDLDRIELMCFKVNDAAMTSRWAAINQPQATSKSEWREDTTRLKS